MNDEYNRPEQDLLGLLVSLAMIISVIVVALVLLFKPFSCPSCPSLPEIPACPTFLCPNMTCPSSILNETSSYSYYYYYENNSVNSSEYCRDFDQSLNLLKYNGTELVFNMTMEFLGNGSYSVNVTENETIKVSLGI